VGERYAPHPGGYRNAADHVAGIKRLADAEVSVSAYPERHPESPTVEADRVYAVCHYAGCWACGRLRRRSRLSALWEERARLRPPRERRRITEPLAVEIDRLLRIVFPIFYSAAERRLQYGFQATMVS
jgi:hypothetical protein